MMETEISQWELVKTHDGNRNSTMMGTEIPQWELVKTHDGNRNFTMGISLNP